MVRAAFRRARTCAPRANTEPVRDALRRQATSAVSVASPKGPVLATPKAPLLITPKAPLLVSPTAPLLITPKAPVFVHAAPLLATPKAPLALPIRAVAVPGTSP